ncbi:MAG: T9SS type A sorting domain-containing protein [Bacteroidia bacterium]
MKNLFLAILFLITLNTFGQANVYKPFPNVYGNWHLRTTVYPNQTQGPTFDSLFHTAGDTILNTSTYKKVNKIFFGNGCCPPSVNTIYTGGVYAFAYRNDSLNKKVYIVPKNSPVEYLWYNFNLSIGDTIKNCYSVYTGSSLQCSLIVNNIDSVLICSKYYKRYIFNTAFATEFLIEGVGFTTNFIRADIDNCTFEPDRLSITQASSKDACLNLSVKSNLQNSISAKIYPNPANEIMNIELNSSVKNLEVSLTDMLGRSNVLKDLESDNNNFSIDLSAFANGIYIIKIRSEENFFYQKITIQH